MKLKLKTSLVVFFVSVVTIISAQTNNNQELFNTIKAKDNLLFEVGFNNCNLSQIEKLISNDIEFYHDKDGVVKSKTAFIKLVQKNLCVTGENKLKRVLDETNFEVFPLYENGKLYGALQNGIHLFGNVKANYSHLWLLKSKDWKLARVLSYNHHQEKQDLKGNTIVISKEELKKYVGSYKFSPEFVLNVRVKDGKLFGGSQGQEVEIICYEKHKFTDREQSHDLEFIMDNNGKISSIKMKSQGMEMTGLKIQ